MKSALIGRLLTAALVLLLGAPLGAAPQPDNSNALQGMDKAQIYFDVNVKDDDLLVFRLKLLDTTIRQLREAGVEVSAVIGIRGEASRFVTRDTHYVLDEQVDNKRQIQERISSFARDGITIEQCALAAEIFDIAFEDFLPEITLVGNGYISLIAYQARGYSVVPMD